MLVLYVKQLGDRFPGDIREVDANEADQLIRHGVAVEAEGVHARTATVKRKTQKAVIDVHKSEGE